MQWPSLGLGIGFRCPHPGHPLPGIFLNLTEGLGLAKCPDTHLSPSVPTLDFEVLQALVPSPSLKSQRPCRCGCPLNWGCSKDTALVSAAASCGPVVPRPSDRVLKRGPWSPCGSCPQGPASEAALWTPLPGMRARGVSTPFPGETPSGATARCHPAPTSFCGGQGTGGVVRGQRASGTACQLYLLPP